MTSIQPVIIGIVIITMILVGQSIIAAIDLNATREYIDAADEWCTDHDGKLHNARAFGNAGGLHCVFENGSDVHMRTVNLTEEGYR